MTPTLWSLSYSPWSDRVRWALEHRGVAYTRTAYQPMLGEPAMRLKLRRWTGPVSVPVLFTEQGPLTDSFDIAQYADRHGAADSSALFPASATEQIRRLNVLSEAALCAGRDLGLRRVLDDQPEVLDDYVPAPVRRLLGTRSRIIAKLGLRRTLAKYANVTPATPDDTLREFLDALAAGLEAVTPDAAGDRYLLGEFSYADITMAEGLSFIRPPGSHLRLSDGARSAYTWGKLPAGYDALFAWRDALYASRPLAHSGT